MGEIDIIENWCIKTTKSTKTEIVSYLNNRYKTEFVVLDTDEWYYGLNNSTPYASSLPFATELTFEEFNEVIRKNIETDEITKSNPILGPSENNPPKIDFEGDKINNWCIEITPENYSQLIGILNPIILYRFTSHPEKPFIGKVDGRWKISNIGWNYRISIDELSSIINFAEDSLKKEESQEIFPNSENWCIWIRESIIPELMHIIPLKNLKINNYVGKIKGEWGTNSLIWGEEINMDQFRKTFFPLWKNRLDYVDLEEYKKLVIQQESQECKTPCGENHCDTNGCSNRKRELVPIEDQIGEYLEPANPVSGFSKSEQLLEEASKLRKIKNADYSRGNINPHDFFYSTAKKLKLRPVDVWAVLNEKHQAAFDSFVQHGSESEPIEGRVTDLINYLLIFIDNKDNPEFFQKF